MLDYNEFKEIEQKYLNSKKEYDKILKQWEERAKEICAIFLYMHCSYHEDRNGNMKFIDHFSYMNGDCISLTVENDLVKFNIYDFENSTMGSATILVEDFIDNNFYAIISKKLNQVKSTNVTKEKLLEEKEKAELKRLLRKYGNIEY